DARAESVQRRPRDRRGADLPERSAPAHCRRFAGVQRRHQSRGPEAAQDHHRPGHLMSTLAANIPATKKLPRLRWPIIWTVVVTALIVWGMHARLERYITPQRGIGYWLGITGGSMM